MENRYQHTVDGQEVNEDDINLIATEAALADDHTLAELLRLTLPTVSGTPGARGVLPASSSLGGSVRSAIVVPSGSADAKVTINGFRAVIGSGDITSGRSATYEIRSAPMIGTPGTGLSQQFAASAGNNRWDLLYVKVDVDVDDTAVNRFVKTTTDPAVSQSVVTLKKTVASLGVVVGTEAGTPGRPALPADSGSSFYIALAYVLLPSTHTLTSAIPATNIQEVATVLTESRAMGTTSIVPASGMSKTAGIAAVNEGWTPASGRPYAYLPPTMTGGRTLIVALHENSTPRTITLGTTGVIDSSVDWRNRFFKIAATFAAGNIVSKDTGAGTVPVATTAVVHRIGQSFRGDFGGGHAGLASFSPSDFPAMGASSSFIFYVDTADGSIKCDVSANTPAGDIFLWIEATGQFNNAV